MGANLDLTGDTIASTYVQLLHTGATEGVEADATAHYLTDGNGTQSTLSISTTRVGIGTEAPVTALNVHSAGGGECTLSSTDATLENGEILGSLYFGGIDSAYAKGAYIQAIASDEWDTIGDIYDAPTKLNFHTQSNGGTDNLASPRMTILETGNVGIGTDTPSATFHVKNASAHDTIGNTGARLMNFGTNITDPLFALQIDASDGDLHIIGIDSSWYDFLKFDRSTRALLPGGNKTADFGIAGTAWDDVVCDDVVDEADFYNFDEYDDLATLHQIKGSGKRQDYSGYELINDDTLPDWLCRKYKKGEQKGEKMISPDGNPYLSLKTMISLLMGAVRQLDTKNIEAVKELSAKVTALENA